MFTVRVEAGFGEVRSLDSEGVFIQHYFTMDVDGLHRFVGLDLDALIPGKVGLKLFEKILIGIVDIIFQNDADGDSTF